VIVKEATVAAPPELVFRALTDPAERAEWQSSFDEAPLEGPLVVGTRIRATRRGSTSGSTYELAVTGLDAPRRLAMDAYRNGHLVARTAFALAPAGAGTRVRSEAEVKLSGLQRMLAPVVNAEMEKRLDAELASLKRHVEKR
jgi:uncharacterized protein YndB with AHSA1/START domain